MKSEGEGGKRALLIAYHFPPYQGSSGVHRTLGFAKYLKEFGWNAVVLTTTPSAYPQTETDNYRALPEGLRVIRAPALDTGRHLSVAGRYPRWLATPDRWQSWIPSGILWGSWSRQARRVDVVYSTFPIVSAHVIGHALHRILGAPWVADFRDPMIMPSYPTDRAIRRAWETVERRVVRRAARITVTTQGAADQYLAKYSGVVDNKITVIPNGFDEGLFSLAGDPTDSPRTRGSAIRLLHSGALYPQNRNPEPFLRALSKLLSQGFMDGARIEVLFRASGCDERYHELVRRLDLQDVVRLEPSVSYSEALQEMTESDALLVFQGPDFNRQVPAKVYEYLFTGRPILAMAEPDGDTARLLRDFGIPGIAALNDEAAIEAMLRASLPRVQDGTYPQAARSEVQKLSRRSRAGELAAVFDDVAAGSS